MVFRNFQSSDQRLFFCSDYGVNIYDGYKLKTITTKDGLPSDKILDMTEVGEDDFFFATDGNGIFRMLHDTIIPNPVLSFQLPDFVRKICYAPGYGLILLDKDSQLYLVPKGLKQCQPLKIPRYRFSQNTGPVILGNNLYLPTEKGLIRYDLKTINENRPVPENVFPERINNIFIPETGDKLYFSTENRLYLISGKNSKSPPIRVAETRRTIKEFAITQENLLWYTPEGRSIHHKNLSTGHEQKLPGLLAGAVSINHLMSDATDNLWISTLGDGVFLIKNFYLSNYTETPSGKRVKNISRIFEASSGTILASSIEDRLFQFTNSTFAEIRSFQEINTVVEHPDDYLLIGNDAGLQRLQNGRFEKTGYNGVTRSLFLLNQDSLFLGAFEGLILYNLKKSKASPVHQQLANRIIICLARDLQQNIWIGTDSGLFQMHNGVITHFTEVQFGGGNYINFLKNDTNGRLWVGTNKGLSIYQHKRWRSFSTQEGLSHDFCTSIIEDSYGNIWLGTRNGLNHYDKRGTRILDKNTGILSNEIRCLFEDSKSRLWIGTNQGISSINLEEYYHQREKYEQSIVIDEISSVVKGKKFFFNEHKRIVLKHARNNLQIKFTSPRYTNTENVVYQYRLGSSRSVPWQTAPTSAIQFNRLPPDEYKLYLRSYDPLSKVYSPPAIIDIVISTPFWRTWWFILLSLTGLVGLGVLGSRAYAGIKLNSLRRKRMLEKQMVELEQKAFNAQMNPHFVFNALNSIQYYVGANDKKNSILYLSKFAALIRLNIEHSFQSFIPISVELDRLKLYLELEKLRFGKKMEYEINQKLGEDQERLYMPSMLLQPFVENAIWHGLMPKEAKGSVVVNVVYESPERIRFEIVDDGVGINQTKKSEGHKSRGTFLIQKRLELLSVFTASDFKIEIRDRSTLSPPSSGTIISIGIPKLESPPETA